MANKGILSKNYYIVPEAVTNLGAEVYNMMAEADQAMTEASEIIADIASLTERVPSQIRSAALLEACASAQAEIKSVDFFSYGQKVEQGLQNLLDHNQYITESFIKNMEMQTEKMRGLGEEFKRLTDSISYSEDGAQPKENKLLKVYNAENGKTEGEEENASVHGTDDLPRAGAEEALEINTEEVMIKSGEIILLNYMIANGLGDKSEREQFVNWISVGRPDLLQQLCAANLSSAEEAEQVLDKIFNEIAVAQREQGYSDLYMEIYDVYRMNMAIAILEDHLEQIEDDKFSEFSEFSDPNTWTDIEEVLQRDFQRRLINLYETQDKEGRAGVFVQLMREYQQSVDYIFDHISEEDVETKEQMYCLPTCDLLARMIYQEDQNPADGRQSNVLWATINRYFSEKNFTKGEESTIRNVLLKGGYESINRITVHEYDAYHPDYDSEGWENAKLLAAILYSQIGEENSDHVDEASVRDAIQSSCDIYGNNIENTIGNCDSFIQRWTGDISYNYFYEMPEYNGS